MRVRYGNSGKKVGAPIIRSEKGWLEKELRSRSKSDSRALETPGKKSFSPRKTGGSEGKE